ncbi:uncharacterized protein LOC127284048 [Leptopilina boulardi]|uniref:uncharacterized protein LOC127284048 n=1 Tax=Leptopilina boulardi TaxID=63433 RepID=UPI0021F577B0|nr:uncharacterized protein LOC127284048 [Leptopilina boulardi]
MPTIIKKDVQKEYSGKGKLNKGVGKKDFSKTNTYLCIKDAMNFKLSNVKEAQISSAIGIWLSQSNDREGGRKERQNTENKVIDKNNATETEQNENLEKIKKQKKCR